MPDLDDEVARYLLDPDARAVLGVAAPSGATDGAIGLLRRLYAAYPGDPCGASEQVDVGAAVAALHVPDAAQSLTFTVEAQPVRVRTDGKAATAAVGLLIPAGTVVKVTGRASMQALSVIGTAAGAVIDVAYWT